VNATVLIDVRPRKRVRTFPARVQFAPQLQSDNALGSGTDLFGSSG